MKPHPQTTSSAPTSAWKRLIEVFLEVVIAAVLVAVGIWYVASHPRGSLDWGRIALAINTVLVFGFLISWFRQAWGRLAFWTVLIVLLLGHTAAYVLLLSRSHDFPLAYYVIINSIELGLFTPILRKLLRGSADSL